ncbi:ADP-ribosylglycohydrolase family protein [Herbihabitans rhizosphaerae]|uniref:ADP-ribosylglycohydrolase family protein n=1 Tax=Herbihabitans rhizosphaerae TaxID=1872711 RepID=UPI001F5EFBE2|nr:ADP-ribosylglycohydrolase family protein [Herbihabitans rhizosphaerae]
MAGDPVVASLVGLAVGDAYGEQAVLPTPPPWRWTDDAEMACSVYAVLARDGRIDQDVLAASFAEHYDPDRGYGSGAGRMLLRQRAGEPWRDVAADAFGGNGSWGNGAAMRVAPVGVWFRTSLDDVVDQAAASARVTHTHPEGVAGAVGVAVAAAVATTTDGDPAAFLDAVAPHVPDSEVRDGIRRAGDLIGADAREAAGVLGTGGRVSAMDTVPLALWLVAHHLDDFAGGVTTAAEVSEDVDTMCAIVGGIVAARVTLDGIPAEWRAACEPLPEWCGLELR